MSFIDLIVLPVGCIACGVLSAWSFLGRRAHGLRHFINTVLPYKTVLGAATAAAGLLSLVFPASGPSLFGSFFPGITGLLIGVFFSLEILMDAGFLRRYRETLAQLGNALLYLRNPMGLFSIFIGIAHFLFHEALFF